MDDFDIIKKILVINLEELYNSLKLNLSIEFKNDEFNILDKHKNIIYQVNC